MKFFSFIFAIPFSFLLNNSLLAMDPEDTAQKATNGTPTKKQRERTPQHIFESPQDFKSLVLQTTQHLNKEQWEQAIGLFNPLSHHPDFKTWVSRDKMIDQMVTCFMRKAAVHFQKGERLLQLACYEKALEVEGISEIMKARLHANIGCAAFQIKEYERAALHCLKAEEHASLDDITKVIGESGPSMFYNIYRMGADSSFKNHPGEALKYLKSIVKLQSIPPLSKAIAYAQIAGLYENLKEDERVLEPAIEALAFPELRFHPELYNKTLCLASASYFDKGNFEETLKYFKKIASWDAFVPHERAILYMNAGHCYTGLKQWDSAVYHYQKTFDFVSKDDPGRVGISFRIALCYGFMGQLEKEKKVYQDIQQLIPKIKYKKETMLLREDVKSIQKLATFFLLKERSKEKEERLEKEAQEKKQKRQEEKLKSEERQKLTQQRRAEEIKAHQEVQLDKKENFLVEKEKRKELEPAREDNKPLISVSSEETKPHSLHEIPEEQTQPDEVPLPKQKVKTRGKSNPPHVVHKTEIQDKDKDSPLDSRLDKVLQMGMISRSILEKIREEKWQFSRKDYLQYLKDVGCNIRPGKGSHFVAQLPNRLLVEFQTDEGLQEELVFLDTENLSFGSATLPPWEEEHIPFYMREQIRDLQKKIERIVEKAVEVKHELAQTNSKGNSKGSKRHKDGKSKQ